MYKRKARILFLSVDNACRSQIAEAYANQLGKDWLEAKSAGMQPQGVSSAAIKVMAEESIDISHQQSKILHEDLLEWADLIVTFDTSIDEKCREIPQTVRKKNWNISNPAIKTGSNFNYEANIRIVRDEIKNRVLSMLGGMKMMTR